MLLKENLSFSFPAKIQYKQEKWLTVEFGAVRMQYFDISLKK
jgi:hypothetical protein